jgi:1-acyl-sn-glycerol-3-phosphate acyltransferase
MKELFRPAGDVPRAMGRGSLDVPSLPASTPNLYGHMIRNIIFYLCLFPLTALFSSLCLIFSKSNGANLLSHRLECLWARLLVLSGGIRVEADLSELDPGKNYIFMANHQSNLDIPALFSVLSAYNFRFLAKKELFRIPLFGHSMARTGHINIDRQNRRKAMESIQTAVDFVARGMSLLIFPEGTRNPDPSTLGEFKTGGMIVALKCKALVAPLIVTGGAGVLPKKNLRLRGGTIHIKALQPFDPSQSYSLRDREKFKNDLRARMLAAYLEQNQ